MYNIFRQSLMNVIAGLEQRFPNGGTRDHCQKMKSKRKISNQIQKIMEKVWETFV